MKKIIIAVQKIAFTILTTSKKLLPASMRFPWTATHPKEALPKEPLSESEIKDRFTSISQFMLEYQKQYFEGLKFSLNMWILINSGTAIALLNSGDKHLINIAIPLMCGILLTGAASVHLSNCIHNRIEKLFGYVLNQDISVAEIHISMRKSFSSMRKNIVVILFAAYLFFGLSIFLLCTQAT